LLIKPDPLRARGLSDLKVAQLAADLRLSAMQAPAHRGHGVPDSRCVRVLPAAGLVVLFSRDAGMHESGWFKNHLFERCLHLSISFRDPRTGEAAPWDDYVAQRIARAFFDDAVRWVWTEGAKSEEGRKLGIIHYRVFCDEHWNKFNPSGEVYSREMTEKGWKSWSDLHGDSPEPSTLHAG
jgi:hypothetical protein